MKKLIIIGFAILLLACNREEAITTEGLLYEMTDLSRLTQLPEHPYRTVQFSSYDRRSTDPTERTWFANSDGFGGEPIPGFEQVLKEPGEDGIGEYLICDIRKPGAVLRLWTAGISGEISFFLDDMSTPVYRGNAEDFFWNTPEVLSGNRIEMDTMQTFRQFDALYFPISFEKGCRIEWRGNIEETHFYHVGVRIYEEGTKVETFHPDRFEEYLPAIRNVHSKLKLSSSKYVNEYSDFFSVDQKVPAGSTAEIFSAKGPAALEGISFRFSGQDEASILRKSILRIYFDKSTIPQVEAPAGDFFGSAPGVNPFQSLPVSVEDDGTMYCGFIMPFKQSVRIEIENRSDEEISISGEIGTSKYKWKEGSSMHFMTRWQIDHGLTAYNINAPDSPVSDILYLDVKGAGRIVGAGTFLYNPTNVPTSWGNWWGEGDEKISIDCDTFPSFFGTGSEDYYNYSWSSARIFSYPYCGQPRNDGPGNRGYVSNFRWHISDDIPFRERAHFLMELGHHDIVPGFSYGRIVYFYALPGLVEQYESITDDDIREVQHPLWVPEGRGGSAGYRFLQAEELLLPGSSALMAEGFMWAEGAMVRWCPEERGEQLRLKLSSEKEMKETRLGFTLVHAPDGGVLTLRVNGKAVKIDNRESVDLSTPFETILDNHFSELIRLKKGDNVVDFTMINADGECSAGIDFIWIRE